MKKYEKIAEWIRNEVEAGALSLGDKLPPENELMVQFQVSRQTVRTALSLLRKEGIVEGRRGSGSYITANVHRRTGKEIRIAVLLTCVGNGSGTVQGGMYPADICDRKCGGKRADASERVLKDVIH